MSNLWNELLDNEEKRRELVEAGKKLAEADSSLTVEELREKALKELGYDLTAEDVKELFSVSAAERNMEELNMEELSEVSGGSQRKSRPKGKNLSAEYCPVYGEEGHQYKADGQSRKTDAWFYNTEEHYVCDCGKGYWDAGTFSIRKWD